MTFEEWWETQHIDKHGTFFTDDIKRLAKKAWCASRGCPVRDSTDDVKLYYCSKCGK